jgi:hypothetical protein
VLLVPQSLARLHHRKDLAYRTVTDAPQSQIALSWPEGETSDLVEEFIGIVRGRTVNSSRGRGAQATAAAATAAKAKPKPKQQPKQQPKRAEPGGRGKAVKTTKPARPRRRK